MKLLLICLLMSTAVYAGPGKITGRVVDENGDAVIGATVQLPESRQGVIVYDLDGRYVVLGVAPGNYTVNVKSIGYKTQIFDSIIVKPDFTTTINATLMEEKIDPSDESYTTRCRPYTILGTQPGFKVSPDSGPCGPRAGYRASADGEIQMSNVAASRRFVRLNEVYKVKRISQEELQRRVGW